MSRQLPPVLNHRLALSGLIGDNALKNYHVGVYEDPSVRVQIIPARSTEQACRIARKYFQLTGTLEIFNEADWLKKANGVPVEPTAVFGGEFEFFSDVRTAHDDSGHRVGPKNGLSRSDNDPSEDGR